MPIWLCIWLLVLPFASLRQPVEVQVLLSFAAACLIIGRRAGGHGIRTKTAALLFTPLHILCLLVGNEQQLPLAALSLVAPLAMAA